MDEVVRTLNSLGIVPHLTKQTALRQREIGRLGLQPGATPTAVQTVETGFLNRVVTVDGVDFRHQVYVPAHLASREFFAAVHERLEPGGVLACNNGALRPDDPVLQPLRPL